MITSSFISRKINFKTGIYHVGLIKLVLKNDHLVHFCERLYVLGFAGVLKGFMLHFVRNGCIYTGCKFCCSQEDPKFALEFYV